MFYPVCINGSNPSIMWNNSIQWNFKLALIRVRSVVRVHCGPYKKDDNNVIILFILLTENNSLFCANTGCIDNKICIFNKYNVKRTFRWGDFYKLSNSQPLWALFCILRFGVNFCTKLSISCTILHKISKFLFENR